MRIARAHHDLNDVTRLEILGWTGDHEIATRPDDSAYVTIEAPKRIEEEFWTFNREHDGLLTCFSDLLGESHSKISGDGPLRVLLPVGKIGVLEVTVVNLRSRITSVLSTAGYRDARAVETHGANGCGFFVNEAHGATVHTSWRDASSRERTAMLATWAQLLRATGLQVDERFDGGSGMTNLYVHPLA